MKIIVIGASGSVGRPAVEALGGRHEIISVGRSSGDIQIDVEDVDSIRSMYEQTGKVDAVIVAIGHGHFGPVSEMSGEQWMKGITHKALPQVNVVLEGIAHMNDGGSFTMTSGVLNRDPIAGGACAASANGAIDSFVLGAAVGMPRGIRINGVSPGLLENSVDRYKGLFPGHDPVSSERVGLAYNKCVEGVINGQIVIID
jgi:NAD(P)-dependent dehydrogenase (short-subunit alcohol dehydrogenase family)